jgi:uncharacterized protein involved in exopolysaccharide biosynthesis
MANQQAQAFEDLRNTINECTRIVRHRWRLGLIGLSVVSSAAFWFSQYLPREYTATTLFERRDDVVLQNLIHANSPYGFEHLKTTMALDMTGSRALAKAAVAVGLLPGDTFNGDGALSDRERSALDQVLARYSVRSAMKLVDSTTSLDTISLRCDTNDPQVARQLVVALRDNYMAATRERIREILGGTREFFVGEIARLQKQVAETDDTLRKGVDDLPGADPTDLVSLGNRLETLRTQRNGTYQHKADLDAQIAAREQFLVAAPGLYAVPPESPTSAPAAPQAVPSDPSLERAIEAVQAQIVELVTLKRMTMEHPAVRSLLERLTALEELRGTLAEQTPPAGPAAVAKPRGAASYPEWSMQQMRVELELDALRRQIAITDGQLNEADARLQRFETLYNRLLNNSDELRQLHDQRGKGVTELNEWQQHLARLERVLAAESGERGTQFTLIEEPQDAVRPVRPRVASIFAVCSGLGLAAAALLAALAELFDRSFRSVGQVTRSLGIPVLECISVIFTPRERRRALISRLIWTPTLAVLLLSLAASAGLAYASIELPGLHQRALQRMDRALSAVGAAVVLPDTGRAS